MLVKTLRIYVQVDHDTLWKYLLDRVRKADTHIPGVTEARILEDSDNTILREMLLLGATVKEKISINPHDSEIIHEYLEHPTFTGKITSKIIPTARQSPVAPMVFEYLVDLHPKSLKVTGLVKGEGETVAELELEMEQIKLGAERFLK